MELSGYQIIEPIGRDEGSESYLAVRSVSGKRVVIKCWWKSRIETSNLNEAISSFLKEGEYLSQVSHPNIANVLAVGETNEAIYCVTDYLCGETLEERADEMCLLDKIYVIKQIAETLDFLASKNVNVQTILPSNILLTTDQSRPCLTRVWQFQCGLEDADAEQDNDIKQNYLSPEQLQNKPQDIRSSLFNLGMVFYYLLAGKAKSMALARVIGENKQSLDETVAQLPLELSIFQEIVDKAIAGEPEQRFQSGRAFVEHLDQISDEEIVLLEASRSGQRAPDGFSGRRAGGAAARSNVITLPVVNRKSHNEILAGEAVSSTDPAQGTEVEHDRHDGDTTEGGSAESLGMEKIGGVFEDDLSDESAAEISLPAVQEGSSRETSDDDSIVPVNFIFLVLAITAMLAWVVIDDQWSDNLIGALSLIGELMATWF